MPSSCYRTLNVSLKISRSVENWKWWKIDNNKPWRVKCNQKPPRYQSHLHRLIDMCFNYFRELDDITLVLPFACNENFNIDTALCVIERKILLFQSIFIATAFLVYWWTIKWNWNWKQMDRALLILNSQIDYQVGDFKVDKWFYYANI